MKRTIGVIGLGSIGSRHARNLKRLGQKVMTYDPVQGHSEQDYANLLNYSDAVVVASPTSEHWNHADEVMDRTRPVFVEKPIADKIHPKLQFVDMVGYNLRFHSCVIQGKHWIDSGFLGKPIWANLVCAQKNERPEYLRDGVILNWSHEIDLALYLLGPAVTRSCVVSHKESIADIVLTHENGCQSTVHLDYFTEPEIRQTIIVGDKATIIMDLVNRQAWLRAANGQVLDAFTGQDSFDDNYHDEMETFLARLDGKETVGCTGKEGLEVLKICLAAKSLSAPQY